MSLIPAKLAKPGVRYLSKTNLPVEVIEVLESKKKVRTRALFSVSYGNIIDVPLEYPLKPYSAALDEDLKRSVNRKEDKDMDTQVKKKRGGLSALMDPLFFEGGHTVEEIANIVAEKDPTAKEGRNLVANIRVRIAVLKKRGYRVIEGENKTIQLVK